MIISASRRTDIPAFYCDWFFRRLAEGFVMTRNPFNPSQEKRVSMLRDDVDAFVFWTKNPLPILSRLAELDDKGYPYYFNFTLTPYGKELERHLPSKAELTDIFRRLSGQTGSHRVLWRYDPIILNDELTTGYHINEFRRLCERLVDCTERVIISFVDLYAKIKTPLIREITVSEKQMIAGELASIASNHGLKVYSCCEILTDIGIIPSACIDRTLIERIAAKPLNIKRDTNQRKGCECVKSADIGMYNSCGNGCVYCYANHSPYSVLRNMAKHDPAGTFLLPGL